MYGNQDLFWRGDCLHRKGAGPVLSIEPDPVYSGMWRVRRPNGSLTEPNGSLTDMVNKTRARDAARSIALGFLNAGLKGRETALEGVQAR
jgi:hypothetical protein